jgi:hypothetical protein
MFPVAAILFHHAIERYLKGGLSMTLSLEEIEKPRHNLNKIWATFKSYKKVDLLSEFDKVVEQLNKFEKLRYPDLFLKEDITMIKGSGVVSMDEESRPMPAYTLVLDDIDRLVQELFAVCGVDLKAHTQFLREEARRYLNLNNKFPLE